MEKIKKFLWGGYTVLGHENDGFEESSKSAANTFNFVMGKMGKAFTKLLATQAVPTGSATGSNVYASSPSYRYNLTHAAPAAEKVIEDNAIYVSPTSHVAAWFQGSWDPKIGAQYLASDPRLLALGIMGDVAAFKYAPKVVKVVPETAINTAAKAGSKTAKKAVVAREINKGITENTKNGRIEVTSNYFNSPYNWYRVANRPEKISIELEGKNVTTKDADYTPGTPNRWRADMLDTGEVDFFGGSDGGRHLEPGKGTNEGYFVFMPGSRIHKTGSAHGNTSLASKGSVWKGSVAGNSELFPMGIIEGQAPSVVPYGRTRSNFVSTPWEEVPEGSRIGFHTGEMPMSNLGWFQRTSRGTYTYESIIPEKRINITENLDWTKNLPGKRDYSMSRQAPYSGYTPIKLSPLYNKFVRDVMQGYHWGKNRGSMKPIGYRNFTGTLGRQIDHGAESYVFNDVNNPNQVLKVSRSNQASTPQRAIELGTREMKARNSLPYNLPLNIEGYYRLGNTYFPVYSLRKVYVPKMDLLKIFDFDSSVDGMYWAKPDVNNILLENGIERAKDFKLPNIGFLPDGTVMGIDLWKNGGKVHFKTNL